VRTQGRGDVGTDPCLWPARHVAAAIAARRISAREYLAAQQARVERYNGGLNAVVTIDERAHEWARLADEAVARGAALGPLHGVAMTVKDCLATSGLRTTGGLAMLTSYTPREDAAVVGRLRRAGAIIVGKTNLPEGSGDLQAFNDVFGLARNPWHPDYSPGGSSGGGAAAVASGLSPLEIGSDIAGSIRIPAANCGVFGHKPSHGIVPSHGQIPPAPFSLRELDLNAVGPIARCVGDLETVLAVIAGPHPWDQPGWRLSLPPARPVRQVATWFDDPYCPVDDEVRAALEEAAEHLASRGITVRPARPPGVRLAASDGLFRRLLATAAVAGHTRESVAQIAAGGPAGPQLGAEFVGQRYWDWVEAHDKRLRLRERWRQFFTEYDAILLPVAPNLAIPHDFRPLGERTVTVNGVQRPYWDQTVWAGLTGVSYLPSTVVPLRQDSRGVPLAIAVAGDYLQDLTTLSAARLLAEARPPLGPPDLTPWETAEAATSTPHS
jgi:amidase